jgi:hypothetical protein
VSGHGRLGVTVWPVYIGCSLTGSTPPWAIAEPHNGGYERGTILWTPVPDARQVIGRARILLPPGVYTHFLYFHHPVGGKCCGVAKMDFPLHCTEPVTVLDIDPIVNNDLALLQMRS